MKPWHVVNVVSGYFPSGGDYKEAHTLLEQSIDGAQENYGWRS
jgi:hypothetical protein